MDGTSDERVLLKDLLVNEQKVKRIAAEIQHVYPVFDKKAFVEKVVARFPTLELTPRIKWIRENLKSFLPSDFREATKILLVSLPPHHDTDKLDNEFGEFVYAPYTDFVAAYGCTKQHLAFSLQALKEMTKRFSAEDAIRYLINAFPQEIMREILTWSTDADYHVRRLASEGTRPKLPWSQKITSAPEEVLPILDNLFSDKSRFVTRSVANHVNDISKINPKLTLTILKKWQKSEKQNPKEMDYIINQALRTLVKRGDKTAISFLNFSVHPQVTISGFHIKNSSVSIGQSLQFTFMLTAQKDERILIDYILYFHNKAGNGHNKKVFKLKKLVMKQGQTIEITKRHHVKHMSTRTWYPGGYKIELQLNGTKVAEQAFKVTA